MVSVLTIIVKFYRKKYMNLTVVLLGVVTLPVLTTVFLMMLKEEIHSNIVPKYIGVKHTFKQNDVRSSALGSPKIILFWTPLYSKHSHWQSWWFKESYLKQRCPNVHCIYSTNRSVLNDSSAILFHTYGGDLNFSDLPKYRNPAQRWIYFTNEPPMLDRKRHVRYNGLFNWTMTYRIDSDVYGGYGELDYTASLDMINYAHGKTRLVAWYVSHCFTDSKREDYVRELQKYIDVDIYGNCGKGKFRCSDRASEKCYRHLEKTYKFYLAFENALCRDYVTEKFYNVLPYNVVPVVFGNADYNVIAPPHSFIDALGFPSPAHLAEYLLLLNSSDDLYNKFFKWKINLVPRLPRWNCELCTKLHDSSQLRKVYKNMEYWWYEKSSCRYWQNNQTHPYR